MKLNWDWPHGIRLSGALYIESAPTDAFTTHIRARAPEGGSYDWIYLFIHWDDETAEEREAALQTLLLVAEAKWAEMKEGVGV